MKKKTSNKKHSFGGIEIMSYKPVQPTINKKNIDALEILMQDPGFKEMLPGSAEVMVKAFKAGQNTKGSK